MADLEGFRAERLGLVPDGAAVPRWRFAGRVVQDGVVLGDFTGANALFFPDVLRDLTLAQRQTLLRELFEGALLMRAGVE